MEIADTRLKVAMFGHKHTDETSGGIEVVVTELVDRLSRHGDRVTVINRWELDKPARRYPKRKNVLVLNAPTVSATKLNAALSSFGATFACLFGHYDVVEIHAEGQCVFIPLLKLRGRKVVAFIHGLDWQRGKWKGLASRYIRFGEKMAGWYADEIIVLSEDEQAYFRDTYGRRARLVENGSTAHLTNRTQEIEKFGLARGSYFLYLGRIVPEKRLDLLIRAYLAADTDKQLVVAGAVPEDFRHTEEYREAEASRRIIFTGFAAGELKAELYANTHCFVIPSDLEGQSVALLDAMGYGVRVLCSDIQENTRLLHGFGDVFRKGDAGHLAEKLTEISRRPFLRSAGQADYIRKEHGWDRTFRENYEVLRRAARK